MSADREDMESRVAEWKRQYGEVYEIRPEAEGQEQVALGVCYFRKPERAHLSRFAKQVLGDTLKAMHTLIMDCLLFPEPEVMEQAFGRQPGLVIALGGELQKLVGTNMDFSVRRL